MPRASDPSSDSDSDSDELQRIKEAVFDVHQQQARPSNGVASSASKAQTAEAAGDANKSREKISAKSARYDSDEDRDDFGREFFSRDVQQFIAKKLTKFLDDTIESSASFLTSRLVAGEDVGREAEVSASVKVFSCSTAPATLEAATVEDAPTKGRRKKHAHNHRNEAHRMRGEVGRSGSTKAEKKRAISPGDTTSSSSSSSSSSSGSEEEETRQLELSSVAVSAEDVLREQEVLHKYGVKRLGKLEVYRLSAPAAANAAPNCSCDRVKTKDRDEQVGRRESGEANEKLLRTVEAGTAAKAAAVSVPRPDGGAAVKCGSGQCDERLVSVNGRDEAVITRRAKRRRHKKLNKEFI